MSVSSAQKRAKPSPVPGPSTEVATPGFAESNASPTRALMGSTVEEPEMTIWPLSSDVSSPTVVVVSSPAAVVVVVSSVVHAANVRAKTARRVPVRFMFFMFTSRGCDVPARRIVAGDARAGEPTRNRNLREPGVRGRDTR